MKIESYRSKSGKDLIEEYIESLSQSEQIDAYRVIACLKNNEFDCIRFKQWERKIYEVYFRKHNRIFYVAVDNETLYLLHACKKQKNKTQMKDAMLVRKRAKELGHLYNKEFI